MKKETRREHSPVKAASAEASERAAHLAPPEERDGKAARRNPDDDGGTINLDTGSLKLPDDYIEERKDRLSSFRPDPVVVIIFFLSLAFIALIAYLISIEPPR